MDWSQAVRALLCLELILNAVNLNLVTFSDFFYFLIGVSFFTLCFSPEATLLTAPCARWRRTGYRPAKLRRAVVCGYYEAHGFLDRCSSAHRSSSLREVLSLPVTGFQKAPLGGGFSINYLTWMKKDSEPDSLIFDLVLYGSTMNTIPISMNKETYKSNPLGGTESTLRSDLRSHLSSLIKFLVTR